MMRNVDNFIKNLIVGRKTAKDFMYITISPARVILYTRQSVSYGAGDVASNPRALHKYTR